MKFLVIFPNLPYPPDKGEKIRNLAVLQSLAKLGEIEALFLTNQKKSAKEIEPLRKYCRRIQTFHLSKMRLFGNFVRALLSGQAFSAAKANHPQLKKYLQNLNYENFDLIFISSSNLFSSIPLPALPANKIFWDLIDIDSSKWQELAEKPAIFWKRWLFKREARGVLKNESLIFEYSQQVFVINARELSKAATASHKKLSVLPACWPDLPALSAVDKKANCIAFSGNFNYYPNIIAAEFLHNQILPLLKSESELLLVGNQASRSLKNSLPKASFSGAVSDSRAEIAKASVYVAPLFDFYGSPLKILEALACNLPVITTNALAKIYNLENSVSCLTAESASEFASAIEEIFNNPSLALKISAAAALKLSNEFSIGNLSNILAANIKQHLHYTAKDITKADTSAASSPLVSVIMPFYNSARFIEQALNCLLNQEYQHFELIAVDDGSQDDSALQLEQITASWKQSVKLVKQNNFGSYAARNRGLDLARGEFIAFYDIDDCWNKTHLSASVAALNNQLLDGVYSDCRLIDLTQQGKVIYNSVFRPNNNAHRFLELENTQIASLHIIDDPRAAEFQIRYGLYLGLQFSVFRKQVFESYRFESNFRNEAEDQLTVIKLLKSGVKLGYLDEPHGDYQIHTSNSSGANQFSTRARKIALRMAIINGFERIRPSLNQQEDLAIRQRIAAEHFWHLGYLLGTNHKEWFFALSHYCQGIRVWPYEWRFYKSLFLLPAHILKSYIPCANEF